MSSSTAITARDRLTASLDALLAGSVAAGDVPQVVGVAATSEGILYTGAAGNRAYGIPGPVGPETVFHVASMKKILIAVVALQAIERGELEFDAPVERYVPQFSEAQVLDRFENGRPVLRAPRTRATIRQLFSHSSGLALWFWSDKMAAWEQVTDRADLFYGHAHGFQGPLMADPGEEFVYGSSFEWLVRAIEATTGVAFDNYCRERIFEPLCMQHTYLGQPPAHEPLVSLHRRTDLSWAPVTPEEMVGPGRAMDRHGLYATPLDFLRLQLALIDGSLDGVQVLSPELVREVFRDQLASTIGFPAQFLSTAPAATADFHVGDGHRWGCGVLLNTEPCPGRRAARSGGWGGMFNTYFWVDPSTRLAGGIYSQYFPFVDPTMMRVYGDFERGVYALLEA